MIILEWAKPGLHCFYLAVPRLSPSTMTADAPTLYAATEIFREQAFVSSHEEYEHMYRQSVEDPEGFWRKQAERLDWFEPFRTVKDVSFGPGEVSIGWYLGGKLNLCYNAVDRHVENGHGDRPALLLEPDEPGEPAQTITYRDVHDAVQRMANVLKALGVEKGDRVTIYLPMIPEAVYAMLACARIGAVFSVVFAGFSPASLAERIGDGESDFVITADEGRRGGKRVPLKANVDLALKKTSGVRHVLTVRNTGSDVDWQEGRDVWLHDKLGEADDTCPCEPMDSEDPLFILYTSGSTGRPKGVVHTTGGYGVYTSLTQQLVFDCHTGDDGEKADVFWCTADVGWITGHSYIAFGPMLNGATQVFFEGVPTYPDAGRFWEVVDKHRVSIFYTAPTAIRALMAQGDAFVEKSDRSSLRVLGTVGEPINPEAWRWYHRVVGGGRCPIVDTWWQTETGGIMIAPLPGGDRPEAGLGHASLFRYSPTCA